MIKRFFVMMEHHYDTQPQSQFFKIGSFKYLDLEVLRRFHFNNLMQLFRRKLGTLPRLKYCALQLTKYTIISTYLFKFKSNSLGANKLIVYLYSTGEYVSLPEVYI